jgi:uncharacterized membrane protein
MGRHSAPDDEPDDAATTTATLELGTIDLGELRGRHSRPDEEDVAPEAESPDERHTQVIAPVQDVPHDEDVQITDVIVPPEPAPPAEAGTEPAAETTAETMVGPTAEATDEATAEPVIEQPKKEGGTRADLRLLRENAMVRMLVLGAVVLSFLIYTIVMFALGHSDSYLLWLWVPIVVAGVGVGAVLDVAHRRANR